MKLGPRRQDLCKKILNKLENYPEGIWIRKLARILKEPTPTIYKYIFRKDSGYPGKHIQIIKQLPPELGGHTMIKLKKR